MESSKNAIWLPIQPLLWQSIPNSFRARPHERPGHVADPQLLAEESLLPPVATSTMTTSAARMPMLMNVEVPALALFTPFTLVGARALPASESEVAGFAGAATATVDMVSMAAAAAAPKNVFIIILPDRAAASVRCRGGFVNEGRAISCGCCANAARHHFLARRRLRAGL
ncbi:hypothetical protein SPHINGO361_150112 [Sphingomonas sp. EC-HK361]|nr:hypothetical protein SPHINGO361_150112 [Sphingomonas sp. EC-HK361]